MKLSSLHWVICGGYKRAGGSSVRARIRTITNNGVVPGGTRGQGTVGAKVEPDLKVIKMLGSRTTPWRGVDEELWTAVCP